MPASPAPFAHLVGLVRQPNALRTRNGHAIHVWSLTVPPNAPFLSSWAAHFRNHYCLDTELDQHRQGTGLSRRQFLEQILFPDQTVAPGPSIRAGDFSEILVSDYLEGLLRYRVPRAKFSEKTSRNESAKGVDVIGFKILRIGSVSAQDELIMFEVKGQLSAAARGDALQKAINDSRKDHQRLAYTLFATKRRARAAGDEDLASQIERFQNMADHPFQWKHGAAAVVSSSVYDEALIQSGSDSSQHVNPSALDLVVIHGNDLMTLANALYARAAHEA